MDEDRPVGLSKRRTEEEEGGRGKEKRRCKEQYEKKIINMVKDKRKMEFRIACHNINGLKNQNSYRMEAVLDWAEEEEISVVGIVETNISNKEAKWLVGKDKQYLSFWADADAKKKKGSGIGVLIRKDWGVHVARPRAITEYIMEISLLFRQLVIVIIIVYIPPNDKEQTKNIQQYIVKRYIQRKPVTQFIILGDFNHVLDEVLDRFGGEERAGKKQLPLYRWLENQNFYDTFRELNPNKIAYTWSRNESKSRIDMIWISGDLFNGLKKAEIQEADCITGSDHEFVLAEIELSEFLKINTAARNRKKKYVRKVYEYGKARREDWESFRTDLQQTIEKKPSIKYLEGREASHDGKQLINKVWDAISDSIIYAANKNIPYKKISNTVASKSAKKLRSQLHQEVIEISKLVRILRKYKDHI